MAHCVTGKKMYPTREIAEDVLIEARTQYDYAESSGPIAVYLCEDCGQFHLTSKGVMNAKLAQYLAEGKIQRQKEANRWMEKFKKR